MSLYLDYRPTSLNTVIGNKELKSSLDGMFNSNSVPHTILLHGPTGCGKTTIGRIIATKLGCADFDYREIDSADFRGIDTVREIRKNAQLSPISGPVKVYLLDEVHKMTNDAQNALLKILEDTPHHVYFILATTNPEKLLKTVKGRCSMFQVQLLTESEMVKLLNRISKKEGHRIDKEILEQIAEDTGGHPRNAIQVLEQVLNAKPEERLNVAKRQGEVKSETIELARLLIKGSGWNAVRVLLKGLKSEDPESIRRMILAYCQSVLLNSDNERAGRIMEEMLEPFYNTNFPGLVYACYAIVKG